MRLLERADLELVTALATSGSLTAVAAELHVAQPALSRRLARLERIVGAPLFTRSRAGTTPNALGRLLAERAEHALAAIDRAERDTLEAAAGRVGRLRIGTTPTLGADLLPAVLAAMRTTYPDVALDLATSGDSFGLRQQVRDGRLDVAVAVVDPDDLDGLRVGARGPQRFVVVLPDDHALARRASIPRRALTEERIVALSRGQGLRVVLDELFADLGQLPVIGMETAEREMLIPLVAAGFGVTILPEVFAAQRTATGSGLRTLPLRPGVSRTVGAIMRDDGVPALVESFDRVVRATAFPPN